MIKSLNRTSRAIHEGALVIAQGIDTKKQGAVQGGTGREFRIGIEIVFDPVAEKNFVPEHILRAVKNWLAGDEALPGQRKRIRGRGFLFGRGGFHPLYIGAAGEELQGVFCAMLICRKHGT